MKKEKLTGKPRGTPVTQHAALCFRQGEAGRTEVLLVTSRDSGRWVLPKGWPKKGEGGGQCALREAGEEAGVVGKLVDLHPAAYYFYDKAMRSGPPLPCSVGVHPVSVQYLDFDFPEMHQRRREWFTTDQAAAAVAEPDLKEVLARFELPR